MVRAYADRLVRRLAERIDGAIGSSVAAQMVRLAERIDGVIGSSVVAHMVRNPTFDLSLMLQGRCASWALREREKLGNLSESEFQVYSQWGEDGIIEWLIQHVPVEKPMFVEFGVENYLECNTRFLLKNRNWKGLVFDGSAQYMEFLRSDPLYWRHDLTAEAVFVTRENINDLLLRNGFEGDIGLLSVDIDGNDYWVIEAIECISPRILVCEYNPVLGDEFEISVPYRADFSRLEAHYSGQYFGASIAAIRSLAERKGYVFVGTNSNGINAFFVRQDVSAEAVERLDNIVAYPSLHRDSRDESGNLTYTSGMGRFELIRDMEVVELRAGNTVKLGSLGMPYSEEWRRKMLV